ncbi:MAG: SpoIIE family protein phosphatase [Bacteroidota bacterium]
MKLFNKLINFFKLSAEEKEIVQNVVKLENFRRVQFVALFAMPVSAVCMIIFGQKLGNTTGIEHQWRTAITASHAGIFISFLIISVLIYFFSYWHAKNKRFETFCINLTIIILLMAGTVITTADQLMISSVTPYLITCAITGLILLIPPLYASLYFITTYIIFYFAISLTQVNHQILISNQINGITACGLGMCLSFILWRGYLIRIKQSRVIEKRNKELRTALDIVNSQKSMIETAHEEITASINYAKYIQSSVLPKAEQMELYLGEHFILFRPAEIISGDFYWVSEIGNKTVIVAADCTGHGVPGAFMSMLGITLLNEIVNKDGVSNPGVILDRLRKAVTDSLKQKGDRWEQKDGMDIALCTIDRENMKLQFAGAINSLYLIRNSGMENIGKIHNESTGNNRIIEIKGDPMPIGIVDDMDNFVCHEIDILKDDSYYLFTDGFPDQFGGSSHKKFSYKHFREQLIKTKTKTMPDQKLLMEKVLNDWIGSNNQTDDILVIGFRIN